MRDAAPLYTIVGQLVGWTLDRTADFPKSQRFTFGQRLDNLSLDCLQQVVRAIYSPGKQRSGHLSELNLKLEELRVLWRLVQQRGWVSQRQLLYVGGVLDELGRMAGGWMKSQRSGDDPTKVRKTPRNLAQTRIYTTRCGFLRA